VTAAPVSRSAAAEQYEPGARPDPLATVGRHLMWVFDAGAPIRHDAYAAAHDGACPPGCRPLPWAPPADPNRASPAWDAWQAFARGIRARARPSAARAPAAAPPERPRVEAIADASPSIGLVAGLAPITGDPYV